MKKFAYHICISNSSHHLFFHHSNGGRNIVGLWNSVIKIPESVVWTLKSIRLWNGIAAGNLLAKDRYIVGSFMVVRTLWTNRCPPLSKIVRFVSFLLGALSAGSARLLHSGSNSNQSGIIAGVLRILYLLLLHLLCLPVPASAESLVISRHCVTFFHFTLSVPWRKSRRGTRRKVSDGKKCKKACHII